MFFWDILQHIKVTSDTTFLQGKSLSQRDVRFDETTPFFFKKSVEDFSKGAYVFETFHLPSPIISDENVYMLTDREYGNPMRNGEEICQNHQLNHLHPTHPLQFQNHHQSCLKEEETYLMIITFHPGF